MFSMTTCVTLEDGSEAIVQFKDDEIDTTKVALARGLLGEIVPSTFAVRNSKAHFAYISKLVKGKIWPECECTIEQNCHVASQLGKVLPRCIVNTSSDSVVDFFVLLLTECSQLKVLPLALCHIDLNAQNILLDENYNISSLIGWELADLMPLGSNAWCIRYLSVDTIRGKDYISDKSQLMAEAFWKSFIAGMLEGLRAHRDAIVIAMQISYIFSVFFGNGGPLADELPLIF
ncbi:uncharacterized protein FOMMEDRAFT_136201 [Fomitiporia mediterranea MF3/22]|uniref:uncharacterized protein n=1 Tax=Fomitiporia mediterranea (strain MF3/22) TaxID=694068 RepID=UPI000440983C|nr:uncharacterized protein FOMMEDRAFT_136201 [Fomitiporia mediterranea MF3/22]EJD00083.1 hypothetical protein FOMMEDRAFT_136201 [Fomitiporia mediterranea MF3/22]